MSEYQYYEFLALDRPLDARAQQELRAVSSRARITATRFVNTYEWGDLRADPRALMASHFDAFLFLSNWGTRQLMFRLPSSVLGVDVVSRYCATDTACAWAAGDSVIVSLTSDKEDEYWDDSAEDALGSILPVRSELAVGDRRLLYLAWLLSVDAGVLDEDELEPPVPAGLRDLSGPLRAVVEFLRLDDDLVSAAAEASEPLTPIDASAGQVRRWVARLPAREKEDVLVQLVSGDQDINRGLVRRFRTDSNPVLEREATRTVAELQDAALQARERRERLAAQRRAGERAARTRSQAAAREQHLTALAARQEQVWTQVHCAIERCRPAYYDEAVSILQDLRAVSEREDRRDAFDQRLTDLHQRHARKVSLVERLQRAGLSAAARRGECMSVVGRWRIADMELWDQDAVDLVAPGFIELEADSTGSFGFIAVQGSFDWREAPREGRPGVEFSWEGFDENDPSSGRGWATLEDDGCLRGRLYFHLGDDSGFHGTRIKARPQ